MTSIKWRQQRSEKHAKNKSIKQVYPPAVLCAKTKLTSDGVQIILLYIAFHTALLFYTRLLRLGVKKAQNVLIEQQLGLCVVFQL